RWIRSLAATSCGPTAARCVRCSWWRATPPPASSAGSSMAKVRTAYVCQNCGASFPQWLGQCGQCKSWNTLVEEVVDRVEEKRGTPASHKQRAPKPIALSEIPREDD